MARAFLLIRLTLVLVGGLAAVGAASAGDGPGGAASPKSTNTFSMVVSATTATNTRVSPPSAGASIAPKSVVSNPYHVPMLQNAGSLHSSR